MGYVATGLVDTERGEALLAHGSVASSCVSREKTLQGQRILNSKIIYKTREQAIGPVRIRYVPTHSVKHEWTTAIGAKKSPPSECIRFVTRARSFCQSRTWTLLMKILTDMPGDVQQTGQSHDALTRRSTSRSNYSNAGFRFLRVSSLKKIQQFALSRAGIQRYTLRAPSLL